MNCFQLTGYIRDEPVETIYDSKTVMAFNFTQDNGKVNLPIYVTDKQLCKYLKEKCSIGCEVEIYGRLASQWVAKDGVLHNRVYLIAESLKRTKVPQVRFTRNVVMSRLLETYDPDDLLKEYKKQARTVKAQKKEKSDD